MGEGSEDVFFSLEDDEPQVSGEKIVAPPSNEVLESVVVLDPEIVDLRTIKFPALPFAVNVFSPVTVNV